MVAPVILAPLSSHLISGWTTHSGVTQVCGSGLKSSQPPGLTQPELPGMVRSFPQLSRGGQIRFMAHYL